MKRDFPVDEFADRIRGKRIIQVDQLADADEGVHIEMEGGAFLDVGFSGNEGTIEFREGKVEVVCPWLAYTVIDGHRGQPEHDEYVGLMFDDDRERLVCLGRPGHRGTLSVNKALVEGGRVRLSTTSCYVLSASEAETLHRLGQVKSGGWCFRMMPGVV